MKKSKVKVKQEEKKNTFRKVVFSMLLFILSLLCFISVFPDYMIIVEDYRTLRTEQITIFSILKLDFPSVQNPIGPFGAFFGYWLITVFGKFFSMSLFLGLSLLSFFNIFLRDEKVFFQKTIAFIFFSFFFNFVIFLMNESSQIHAGYIPWFVFQFFMRIVDRIGTYIISVSMILASIVFIFEIENIKLIFVNFFRLIWKLLCAIFTKKQKSTQARKPKKTKPLKEIVYEEDDVEIISETPKTAPNIIDHAVREETPKDKKKLPIPKRKLSQKPEDMPEEPLREYVKPDIEEFLTSVQSSKRDRAEIEANIKMVSSILEQKLAEFGVEAEVINVNIGPIITQYEIRPASGVKVSRFHSLADDLALAIKAHSIRVQAPIPGRGLVGIEIPNVKSDTIFLKDVLLSERMEKMESPLAIGLGKDISGHPIVTDLAKMPHLLIAGATGSGKSVCINTIITSLLLRTTPDEVRLVMIDPKRIELAGYEGIPHLIQNVVTENEDALAALNWGVSEMERRYELLQKYNVRNIDSYNKKIKKLKVEEPELEDDEIPYIVIIVDEFADLIMTIGRDVEVPISRMAQMARAIGIHLIIATQRPSTKVITGIIKANFPARIAFQVASKIDSRVILDANGAEKLLGRGDSFFLPPGTGIAQRIHGAFIPDEEIVDVVAYLRTQPKPKFEIKIIEDEITEMGSYDYDDELFPQAAVAVVSAGNASVSMLQRHFKIGYARAGRLVDMLEQAGIIGPHLGSKSREVLASEEDLRIYGYLKN
jgi:S-DNA-T family DNA segregation ATPase FtsK/SpoIIIE